MNNNSGQEPEKRRDNKVAPREKRLIRSEDLFQDEREVVIVHGEACYRLQITKAGKLILNK